MCVRVCVRALVSGLLQSGGGAESPRQRPALRPELHPSHQSDVRYDKGCTVEPSNGTFRFVRYSEVSLSQRLLMYNYTPSNKENSPRNE